MVTPPSKVSGLTFYRRWHSGGYMVWALIGGHWMTYEHHDSEEDAKRQATKINRRLLEAAARRANDNAGV